MLVDEARVTSQTFLKIVSDGCVIEGKKLTNRNKPGQVLERQFMAECICNEFAKQFVLLSLRDV